MPATRNAFLTPETLTGVPLCYQLSIPVHLFAYVLGALLPLGETWNWEQEGAVTPEDAAEYFSEWMYGILSTECSNMVVQRFSGRQADSQTIPHNTVTRVNINESVWANAYFSFDPSTDIVTLLNDGHYVLTGQMSYLANATGKRVLWLIVGGENVSVDQRMAVSPGATNLHVGTALDLSANTEVYLQALQLSGGDLGTGISGKITSLQILYFGPEV